MVGESKNIEPFLRWAGGKNWLKNHIKTIIRIEDYNNYHEPFLGGASIFFNLTPSITSFLSDSNSNLIETYSAIKENCLNVIQELKQFSNTEIDYYKIRKLKFEDKFIRAAQFIYLNQTSFNGIYRVNLNGEYNVPYGFRSKKVFNEDHLRQSMKALQNSILFSGDFERILDNVQRNDFVFLDPPYTVSHNKNGFIKYNKKLFSLTDQYRLKEVIDRIDKIGAFYVLTNAAHEKIFEIFNRDSYVVELTRGSSIGGLKAKRGRVNEFLFSNIATISSLQGTLAKPTNPILQSDFAKEPFRPFHNGRKTGNSDNMINEQNRV